MGLEPKPFTQISKERMKNKIILIILAVLILLFGSSAIYLGNYYHSVDVEKYMTGSSEVAVKKFDEGWFFDGVGEEKALIFIREQRLRPRHMHRLCISLRKMESTVFWLTCRFIWHFSG